MLRPRGRMTACRYYRELRRLSLFGPDQPQNPPAQYPPWAGGLVVHRTETPESIRQYEAAARPDPNPPPPKPAETEPRHLLPANADVSHLLPRAADHARPPAPDQAMLERRAAQQEAERLRIRRAERKARALHRSLARQAAARLARHEAQCSICRHPERAAIERDFVDWMSPASLAEAYHLGSWRAVYRHAHFFRLFDRRLANHQMALGRIIEHVHEIKPSGSVIVAALRLSADLRRRRVRTLSNFGPDSNSTFQQPSAAFSAQQQRPLPTGERRRSSASPQHRTRPGVFRSIWLRVQNQLHPNRNSVNINEGLFRLTRTRLDHSDY